MVELKQRIESRSPPTNWFASAGPAGSRLDGRRRHPGREGSTIGRSGQDPRHRGTSHIPVVVSSALETSIGIYSGLLVASLLPQLPYACGLGTVSLIEGDPTRLPLVSMNGELEVRRPEPTRNCSNGGGPIGTGPPSSCVRSGTPPRSSPDIPRSDMTQPNPSTARPGHRR